MPELQAWIWFKIYLTHQHHIPFTSLSREHCENQQIIFSLSFPSFLSFSFFPLCPLCKIYRIYIRPSLSSPMVGWESGRLAVAWWLKARRGRSLDTIIMVIIIIMIIMIINIILSEDSSSSKCHWKDKRANVQLFWLFITSAQETLVQGCLAVPDCQKLHCMLR